MQEIGRVHVIVHDIGVGVPGDVVETGTESPLIVKESKPPFQVQIEAEVRRKASSVRRLGQLLVVVHHAEGKPIPPFQKSD
jgi:hypothetical protein